MTIHLARTQQQQQQKYVELAIKYLTNTKLTDLCVAKMVQQISLEY
jgi:hypothetical protein